MFIDKLLYEKCPVCKEILIANHSASLFAPVIKSCPKGHYEKEILPFLETSIEHYHAD